MKLINTKNRLVALIRNIFFLLNRKKIIQKYLNNNISMSGNLITEAILKHAENQRVLEFGGGSSSVLLSKVCKQIFVVDSEKVLVLLLKNIFYKTNSHVHHADIGPVGSFGTPFKFLRKVFGNKYKNYYSNIYNEFDYLKETDVVIIDGRFRVSCFLNALNNIKPPFKVIYDDFFSRPEYKISDFQEIKILERIDDCAIFQITEDFRGKISQSLLDQFKYDRR